MGDTINKSFPWGLLSVLFSMSCVSTIQKPYFIELKVKPFGNPSKGPAVRFSKVVHLGFQPKLYQLRAVVGYATEKSLDSLLSCDLNTPDPEDADRVSVVLMKGAKIEDTVRGAVTRGFQRAGYRVLSPNDVGYELAQPIEVFIQDFWVSAQGCGYSPSAGAGSAHARSCFYTKIEFQGLPAAERSPIEYHRCANFHPAMLKNNVRWNETYRVGLSMIVALTKERLLSAGTTE